MGLALKQDLAENDGIEEGVSVARLAMGAVGFIFMERIT